MRIEDLKINESFEKIVVKIVNKPEPQEVEYFNITNTICDCSVEDGTGEASLILYDEIFQRINENDIVEITNGYCKIYRGNLQISSERGTIEVIFENLISEENDQSMETFLDVIEMALESNDPEISTKACEILSKKRKASEKGIKTLQELLKDESCCESARAAIIEIAKEDNSFLYDFLLCHDQSIRKIARDELMTVENLNNILNVIFEGNNEVIINEALSDLSRFSDSIIKSVLNSAVNHQNEIVRLVAKRTLENFEKEKKKIKEKEKRMNKLKDTFSAI